MSGHIDDSGAAPAEDDGAGRIVNPSRRATDGGLRPEDGEWLGDEADQANDLRFEEESTLISSQTGQNPVVAKPGSGAPEPAAHIGGYTSHENLDEHGEYTDKNGHAARDHRPDRGHYTGKDGQSEHVDTGRGHYTDKNKDA